LFMTALVPASSFFLIISFLATTRTQPTKQ
jgi:hypothetical protein